jgi:hypothetical protein
VWCCPSGHCPSPSERSHTSEPTAMPWALRVTAPTIGDDVPSEDFPARAGMSAEGVADQQCVREVPVMGHRSRQYRTFGSCTSPVRVAMIGSAGRDPGGRGDVGQGARTPRNLDPREADGSPLRRPPLWRTWSAGCPPGRLLRPVIRAPDHVLFTSPGPFAARRAVGSPPWPRSAAIGRDGRRGTDPLVCHRGPIKPS